LGDIGDISQSQCHNPCEGERKMSPVTLWLTNIANVINSMSPKCYPVKLTRTKYYFSL